MRSDGSLISGCGRDEGRALIPEAASELVPTQRQSLGFGGRLSLGPSHRAWPAGGFSCLMWQPHSSMPTPLGLWTFSSKDCCALQRLFWEPSDTFLFQASRSSPPPAHGRPRALAKWLFLCPARKPPYYRFPSSGTMLCNPWSAPSGYTPAHPAWSCQCTCQPSLWSLAQQPLHSLASAAGPR